MQTNSSSLTSNLSCGLTKAVWNPYIVGAGIGILSWLVFLLVDRPLGMSTEVSKLSGWLLKALGGGDFVAENDYWSKETPKFGYSTVFLIFTAFGAFISSLASNTFHLELVPTVWKERFGDQAWKRLLDAFGGGVLILYGARMAGGCTSGHAISGTLQLAVSSWLFFAAMFVGGVLTARLMFKH